MIKISDDTIISELKNYMEPGASYDIKILLKMLSKKYKETITESDLRQILDSGIFKVLITNTGENEVCEVTLKNGEIAKLPPNQPH